MENIVDTALLKQKVNNLALNLVLAGCEDALGLQKTLEELEEITQEAKNAGLGYITGDLELAVRTLTGVQAKELDPEKGQKTLNTIFARMEDALDNDEPAPAAQETKTAHEPETQTTPMQENGPDPQNSDPGTQDSVYHPATLPSYLTMEDFKEFLTSKMPVLESLETLILDLENGDVKEAPGQIKRILHTMKGESGFLGLSDVEKICHKTEDLLVSAPAPELAEVLLRVKDWFQTTFAFYAEGTAPTESAKTILNFLKQCETAGQATLQTAVQVRAEPEKKEHHPMVKGVRRPVQVDSDRLDHLIDIIGELAIAEAMVSRGHTQAGMDPKAMRNALKALSKSTQSLQKIGLSLRMVPLTPLFNRMNRVARDLAKKQNKPINFIIRGESTELDKNLVDALADPLIHIIRNSIDHGIETDVNQRTLAGKPETATITLEGFHKGGALQIEITDDGQGIDRKKLIEKARAKGLLDGVENPDNHDALNLIFHSGLSTAQQVTDVSGRGIGMDVVRKSITELNGRISLDSEQGKGTTVSIILPLTLSIMDGMVIRAGNDRYVIPTLSIISSIHYTPATASTAMGTNHFFRFREQFIPLLDLARFFADISVSAGNQTAPQQTDAKPEPSKDETEKAIVVVVEDSGLKAGLIIGELVSKQSIVRKSLAQILKVVKHAPGVSGGTILADGQVCLILDVPWLVAAAYGSTDTCPQPSMQI